MPAQEQHRARALRAAVLPNPASTPAIASSGPRATGWRELARAPGARAPEKRHARGDSPPRQRGRMPTGRGAASRVSPEVHILESGGVAQGGSYATRYWSGAGARLRSTHRAVSLGRERRLNARRKPGQPGRHHQRPLRGKLRIGPLQLLHLARRKANAEITAHRWHRVSCAVRSV